MAPAVFAGYFRASAVSVRTFKHGTFNLSSKLGQPQFDSNLSDEL